MIYEPPKHILLRRHTDAITDADLAFLQSALFRQLRDVAGYYDLRPPGVTLVRPDAEIPSSEAVGIDFVDDDGLGGSVAHHGFMPGANFPWSLVGVREASNWTMAASHEAIEMFLNVRLDRFVTAPDGARWPYEVCDMVEGYGYPVSVELFDQVRDVQLSNYVLPPFWGEPSDLLRGAWPYDYLGVLNGPFSVGPGGYALVDVGGTLVELGSSKRHGPDVAKRGRSRVEAIRSARLQ